MQNYQQHIPFFIIMIESTNCQLVNFIFQEDLNTKLYILDLFVSF